MGTGRTLNKKPATRPVKSAGEREATVAKLNAVQVRDYLRTPEKTKAAFAQ